MIIGNPSTFAIESQITQAYERPSSRGLGYFTILIEGKRYGVYEDDATLLAASFDEVGTRLRGRGTHETRFVDGDSASIANAFRAAIYGEDYGAPYPGMTAEEFAEITKANQITWAPDGDEAFDDGSYVLQFDSEDRVRLIAFKVEMNGRYDPSSLRDLWLESDHFYDVLHRWHAAFLAEWESSPKVVD